MGVLTVIWMDGQTSIFRARTKNAEWTTVSILLTQARRIVMETVSVTPVMTMQTMMGSPTLLITVLSSLILISSTLIQKEKTCAEMLVIIVLIFQILTKKTQTRMALEMLAIPTRTMTEF